MTMTRDDVIDVLSKVAAYDRRTVGEGDVLAWLEVLGDLDRDDCLDAVATHYREHTRWLMPADIRAHAEAAAKRRAAAERRQLLRELGHPDTRSTSADGPPATDPERVRRALEDLARRKGITGREAA